MAEQQMEVMERPPEPAVEVPPSERKTKGGNGNLTAGIILIALGALFGIGQLVDFGDITASIIMGGIAIVFAAVYVTGTSRWWALIPAWIFGAISLFIMVEPILPGNFDAVYWMAAIGVPFLVTALTNVRERWWGFIPAGIMGLVGLFLLVENILPGNWDAVYWVSAVGLPFFVTFITNPRERWWALIPFYVMTTVAVFLMLVDGVLRDEAIGAYWTGAVALPFLVVFATNPRERWWALIPGGIFSVTALGLGLAAFELVRWGLPALMVLAGAALLAGQIMRRTPESASSAPLSGPAADKPRE